MGVYMSYVKHFIQILEEEFKHTKGVIRSRKLKNGRCNRKVQKDKQ